MKTKFYTGIACFFASGTCFTANSAMISFHIPGEQGPSTTIVNFYTTASKTESALDKTFQLLDQMQSATQITYEVGTVRLESALSNSDSKHKIQYLKQIDRFGDRILSLDQPPFEAPAKIYLGWCFKVNGILSDVAAHETFLTDEKDRMTWFYGQYTLNARSGFESCEAMDSKTKY
jgi:hypothetical protein